MVLAMRRTGVDPIFQDAADFDLELMDARMLGCSTAILNSSRIDHASCLRQAIGVRSSAAARAELSGGADERSVSRDEMASSGIAIQGPGTRPQPRTRSKGGIAGPFSPGGI